MKQILMTQSFRKFLKKLRKHFSEQDIIDNIKEFICIGLRKGETKLATEVFGNISVEIVKLRIRIHNSVGRYLVGIIDETEYRPMFIDLKTGFYGRNLSFNAERKVASMIESAIENTLADYLEHTEEHPRLTTYPVE